MKFLEVFRYELDYRLREPSTWIYGLLLLGFAVANGADVFPVNAVNANAPFQIAKDAVLAGLVGLVASAALFGDAALRDIDAGMDPLLFTAPQRTFDHLGGRYLAALTTNALILLAVPMGQAVPILVGYPDPSHFGPFRLAAILQPWLILVLPNLALSGAVLFTVALFSRRLIAVYITGFGLFMGGLVLAEIQVGDPTGIGILSAMKLDWTVADQNARLIGSSTELGLNRLLWLAVTGGALVLLHRRFRFEHLGSRSARRVQSATSDSARAVPLRAVRVATSFGIGTTVRQIFAIARNSLAGVAANRWFVVVLLACAGWSAALVEKAAQRPFDTLTWPVTMVVTAVLSRDFLVGLYVLVGLYAGELVWKDRTVGAAEIADATPVAEGTALLGRFLALIGISGMFLAASMAGGIVGQLSQGYYDVEPGLYLRVFFGLNLVNLALIAALVMTTHVVVNHKYLVLAAMMMALVLPFSGPLLRHSLLVYGGDFGWTYSDMNGFGPYLAPFLWFKLYWAGWALLLGIVACALWPRGRDSGAQARFRQARARLTGPLLWTASAAFTLILTVGVFIFRTTNVLNPSDAKDQNNVLRAEYEKRYRRFEDLPQPTIENASLRAEIHPDQKRVELSGSFELFNRTSAPIESIHVSTRSELAVRSISFDRQATPVVTDTWAGVRVYTLAHPLAPGDSTRLSFYVGFRQRGFPHGEIQHAVLENGTTLGRNWFPFVGYQPSREITDGGTRARFSLERRQARRKSEIRADDKVRVDMTIGTATDQIAVASGVLRREWIENGRRYFHYETEAPQPFDPTVISGRYTVRTDSASGVKLSVHHHPRHDRNLETFVRSMKASLTYFTTQFGPYSASDLRIVEVPRNQHIASAHPHLVVFSEGSFIARKQEGKVDLLFFDTVREIARQWWHGRIGIALGGDGNPGLLSETLAGYSALIATEKADGPEVARRHYAFEKDRYFVARASALTDSALLDSSDELSLARIRAPLALYLMRAYLGENAVDIAMRRFVERARAGTPSDSKTRDLCAELRAVTPESLKYLLTDLFDTVTIWNVKTDRAVVEPTSSGEFVVTLDITAKKTRTDEGKETEVPMEDLIEVGAFTPGPGGVLGDPLHLKQYRIRSGHQTIRITVAKEPVYVGIDPYRLLIERKGGDNVIKPIAGVTQRPGAP